MMNEDEHHFIIILEEWNAKDNTEPLYTRFDRMYSRIDTVVQLSNSNNGRVA